MILETIHDPRDIKALNDSQTQLLCTELREFLLKNVSKTGGHLASNLGAVELTVATACSTRRETGWCSTWGISATPIKF